jgi:hypothetical protein
MSRGKGFEHCCRKMVTEHAVPLLQLRHRPNEISQVKDVDLRGKRNQLGSEPCLLFGRQSQHRSGELSGHAWIRKGTAQPKQPQTRCRQSSCQAAEIRRPLSRQQVAKQMVINDNRRHSGRRQIRVIEARYELAVFCFTQRVCDELMARSRREDDDCVAKVDNRDSTALVEAPAVPYRGWDRHLPTTGHQELDWDTHDHTPVTWYPEILPSVHQRRVGEASEADVPLRDEAPVGGGAGRHTADSSAAVSRFTVDP